MHDGKPLKETEVHDSNGKYPEIRERKTANGRDIGLMIFINFLSFVCFAIVLPSLWPFLESLGAHSSIVGWAVAVNSFGTFVGSPILGYWADWRGVKEVIFASLIIMIIGNVLYSIAMNVPVLLAARFIVGIAAANYAPASAYLSYATNPKDRTTVMTLNSAASILGFILGPALATLLTFFKFHLWKLKFDELTSPGWASVILALIAVAFIPTFRDITPDGLNESAQIIDDDEASEEDPLKPNQKSLSNQKSFHGSLSGPLTSAQSANSLKSLKELATNHSLPYVTIGVCLFLQFVFYTAFTIFETIGTPYTKSAYGWSVFDNGLLFAAIGALCILALIILQLFARVFRDRVLLLGTEVIMVAGFAILISWPFHHYVELPRFLVGVGVGSMGFSAACALLISIFSKVLGNIDQGLLMGWLSSSGSIARTIGPIGASYFLEFLGGGLVFTTVAAMLLLSAVVTVLYWTKLHTKGQADYVAQTPEEVAKQKKLDQRKALLSRRMKNKEKYNSKKQTVEVSSTNAIGVVTTEDENQHDIENSINGTQGQ